MKPLIVYHDHCTDGFGAAFAAWMNFKDEAEYLPMSYGDKRVELNDFGLTFPANLFQRDVYILDFSFSKEITEALMSTADRLIWLDHHKTAFETWCGSYTKGMVHSEQIQTEGKLVGDYCGLIYLDDNKSGAMLAWEYFHPGTEVPTMIKHIDDRDRWQFKIPGSKEFHAALASYKPWSFEQWKGVLDEWDGFDGIGNEYRTGLDMLHEGSAILRAHEQNVKSIVDAGRREVTISNLKAYTGELEPWGDDPDDDNMSVVYGRAANCPPYAASDVGHELANQSGTFGLCWYMGRDGKAKVSLRSNGSYDVSAIAKSFGGGGHMNAAGFEVDLNTLQGWFK